MVGANSLARASRNWISLVTAGAAGFAVGLPFYFFIGPSPIAAALTQSPAPAAAAMMAAPFA
ncbi:MAG: hypothetical protein WAM75_21720, partial [Xanthobacteraceae bacterium]